MAKLSPRQARILEFISDYRRTHSYPPSVRDIQAGCSVSSTSVVDYNLRILQREGYIRRAPDVSRGLELLGGEPEVAATPPIMVPMVGSIAAGAPLPVPTDEMEPSEMVALPQESASRRADGLFALRVRGASMIDALVDDGDIIVLRKPTDVHDGDMVAAWLKVEQEATLKRIYWEGNQVRLQPANSQFKPIVTRASNVEVQGKVVAVLRRLD